MRRFLILLTCWAALASGAPQLAAADAQPAPAAATKQETKQGSAPAGSDSEKEDRSKKAAAAKVAIDNRTEEVRSPDFLEHLVDSVLGLFNIRTSGNTLTHYGISALLLVVALLARRIVTGLIFPILRKAAERTSTTLDDKLFPALQSPVAAFVMIVGVFAALKVLKLDPDADEYITYGSRVAFSLAIFWGLWRALGAILDQANEVARARSLGITAFMPWIRRTILTVFAVLGVLLTIQSLGYDVRAILAGLGIGSLAFALAAQDSLANIFGAIVVAVDQPFRIGEAVKIGQNVGNVEDIGLRSTRIRLADKSLMVIPNKTVAAETITNLSRFTHRRFEQVLGLTYDATPQQMDEIVAEIRKIITAQPEVDAPSVMVYLPSARTSIASAATALTGPVLFFDGECGLCNRVVRLLLRFDRRGRLRFAPLQGPTAQEYLRAHGLPTVDFDTIIYVPEWSRRERPEFLVRTAGVIAALRATSGGMARILAVMLSLVPARVRDAGYRVVGHWRYRIFGPWRPRPLPHAEWSARFLE